MGVIYAVGVQAWNDSDGRQKWKMETYVKGKLNLLSGLRHGDSQQKIKARARVNGEHIISQEGSRKWVMGAPKK